MFPLTEYPSLSDVVVYYVTRVVGVPIFVDTDLLWFRTPKFMKWAMEYNLPEAYFDIMKGSLQSTYGCRIPKEVCIELPPYEVEKIEKWLESWKNNTFLRRYTMSQINYPDLLSN